MSRATCPSCGAVLKLADDQPPRKKVKCPECDTVFAIPANDAGPDERVAQRRSSDDDADSDDREPRRPRRRRQAPSGSGARLPVLILAGILAFVVIGGLVAGGIYAVYSLNQKPEVAQAPPNQPVGGAPLFRPGNGGGVPPGLPPGLPPGGQPQQPPAAGQGGGGAGTEVGQLAKEIEGEDIDGKHFKLSDYRGKVVLLDFWGNW